MDKRITVTKLELTISGTPEQVTALMSSLYDKVKVFPSSYVWNETTKTEATEY